MDEALPSPTGHRFTLHWVLWLRVSSQRAADKVLRRFEKALRLDLTVTLCERYWKDLTLHKAQATTSLDTDDVLVALYRTLQIMDRVSSSASVSLPRAMGDFWSFDGDAGRHGIRVVGVHDIGAEIRNYDMPGEARTTDRQLPRFQYGERVRVRPDDPQRSDLTGAEGVISGYSAGPDASYGVLLSYDERVWTFQEHELAPADGHRVEASDADS